nr:hypothetical protein Q903MT_gene1263 [Picea sitchensis]
MLGRKVCMFPCPFCIEGRRNSPLPGKNELMGPSEPQPRLPLYRAKLNPVYPMLHKQRGLPRAAFIAR